MRLAGSLSLVSCALLTVLATEARGADRPRIEINRHWLPPGANVLNATSSAGMTVSGRITRPLKIPVQIRIEHHFEDGKTLQELRIGVIADVEGQFAVSFSPPRGGWLPGRKRTVVCIQNLEHVLDSEDWVVVGPPAKSADFPAAIDPLPKADQDVNLDQKVDLPPLRSEQIHFLKGSFPWVSETEGDFGPPVSIELRVPNEQDLEGTVYGSWGTTSFARDEQVCEFEIELPLTKRIAPGLYLLRVNTWTKEGLTYTVRSIRILPRDEADEPKGR